MEELPDDDGEDVHYDFVENWLKQHTASCPCPALMDAWLTRVWTRQEVLYSRHVLLVTANVWLVQTCQSDSDVWVTTPEFYEAPRATDGVRDLSSCLVTWCARYGLESSFSSPHVLADFLRQLIKGEPVSCSLLDLPEATAPFAILRDWFASNWSMIVNASIRITTHVRDAILSQMLLLPGYRVPKKPWSMPLQDLMVESCGQYQRLLEGYQLVPMVFESLISSQQSPTTSTLAPIISPSIQNATLSDILLSVGSPCTCPLGVFNTHDPQSPILPFSAYEISDHPTCQIHDILDINDEPLLAAEFILTLRDIWSQAADCKPPWNMRECLDDIDRELFTLKPNLQIYHLTSLKSSLLHFIARLTHTTSFARSHVNHARNHARNHSTLPNSKISQHPPSLRRKSPTLPSHLTQTSSSVTQQ